MKSNSYLGFSIAIFPVNIFWQYKLFKRFRFDFLAKTKYLFAREDFSKTRKGPLNEETWLYIIAKQLHFGLMLTSQVKTTFFVDFFLVFLFILYYFE
jgi:hypothetical protein